MIFFSFLCSCYSIVYKVFSQSEDKIWLWDAYIHLDILSDICIWISWRWSVGNGTQEAINHFHRGFSLCDDLHFYLSCVGWWRVPLFYCWKVGNPWWLLRRLVGLAHSDICALKQSWHSTDTLFFFLYLVFYLIFVSELYVFLHIIFR